MTAAGGPLTTAREIGIAERLLPLPISVGRLAELRRHLVAEKGGVSVYGLGRFPVTLYKEQWAKLRMIVELADNHARHVWLQQEGAYHVGLAVGHRLRTRQ